MSVHEYRPAAPKKPPRPKFPVPWGLFVVLAIYGLLVVGYVWKTYWSAPEYQAAEHYHRALVLLGVDDGRTCTRIDLEEAFGHVLEAARLIPESKGLAQHTERLRWRFDERGFKLHPDFARRAELVSRAAREVEEERSPWLSVGARDRGWAPDQLLAAPTRVAWWSTPGVVLILAVWAFGQFSARQVRAREHEAALQKAEADVEALGRWRTGLKVAPSGPAAPSPTEDEQTNPTAPIFPEVEPTPSGRPLTGSRAAVARDGTPKGASVSDEPRRPVNQSGRAAVSRPDARAKVVSTGRRPAVPSRNEGEED